MPERIKTLVLMSLVAGSIFLTALLLFGQPALETAAPPAYERLVFGELRPIPEHIQPVLRLGKEGQWQILYPWESDYQGAWAAMQELLRHSSTPQIGEPPPDYMEQAVLAKFPVSSSSAFWEPASRAAYLDIIAILWLELEPKTLWYLSSDHAWYSSSLSAQPADNWTATLREAFSLSPVYTEIDAHQWPLPIQADTTIIVPQTLPHLTAYSVRQENLDSEKLLRSIFVNTALVRRIEERDGAFIYTDGQRGLRLFQHGEVEYTSPKSEPGIEPMETAQALRRVAQYLQLMGGWPEHVYIEQLLAAEKAAWNRREWDTYLVSFYAAQKGYRVESAAPPIRLRFSDRGVIDYRRQVCILEAPIGKLEPLIEPQLAATTVADVLAAEDIGTYLLDVYPGYYLEHLGTGQAIAQPAWVFVFDQHKKAVVHGHTGRFLAWLE